MIIIQFPQFFGSITDYFSCKSIFWCKRLLILFPNCINCIFSFLVHMAHILIVKYKKDTRFYSHAWKFKFLFFRGMHNIISFLLSSIFCNYNFTFVFLLVFSDAMFVLITSHFEIL